MFVFVLLWLCLFDCVCVCLIVFVFDFSIVFLGYIFDLLSNPPPTPAIISSLEGRLNRYRPKAYKRDLRYHDIESHDKVLLRGKV